MPSPDARHDLLARYGLAETALERVLGTAVARQADYADLFFEHRTLQTASLEDGVVKKATRDVRQGVGVRVLAGARTGYAYSDEVTPERTDLAGGPARYSAEEPTAPPPAALSVRGATHDLYPVEPPPITTSLADQIALLGRIDTVARQMSPLITNVMAGI